MNTQGKIVLWIGLFLITMQVIGRWGVVRAIIFSPSQTTTGGTNSGAGSGGFDWTKLLDPLKLLAPFPFPLLSKETPAKVRA